MNTLHTSNLTIEERERFAYLGNDRAALALIRAGEEDFETSISPEHEALIDDRNRLRSALQECVARMTDAITQLDELNTRDEPIPDDEKIEFADGFHNALVDAETALGQCEAQVDETTAEKLFRLQADWDRMQKRVSVAEQASRRAHELITAVHYLVSPYTGLNAKPAPKWAAYALTTLKRIGEIRS